MDPDKGFIHCFSVLASCIKYSLPIEDDELYKLAQQLLESSQQMDRQEKPLPTAFALANMLGYPDEFQKKLLFKGANVNHLFRPKLLSPVALEPVLNHAIRTKDHERIKQLLEFGANPNTTPTIDEIDIAFSRGKRVVCLLTPFQLTVSLDDHNATAIIRQHCQKKGIPLQAELVPFEQNRIVFDSLDSIYKYQGPKLFIRVNDSIFGDKIVPGLKESFGLNCFVETINDVANVTEAIRWLYEKAPHSCAARFWLPVLERLKQEQKDDKKFAISVGDTANQYHTKQNKSQESYCCGIYHGNISVQTGLTVSEYVRVLAHEIGHLFDAKLFGLGTLAAVTNKVAQSFAKAMKQDLANFKNHPRQPSDFMQIEVPILGIENYPQDADKLKEFFTRVLVHIPIDFAFTHPKATEETLITKMHYYFPETMRWFEELYPAVNDTLDVAANINFMLFGKSQSGKAALDGQKSINLHGFK